MINFSLSRTLAIARKEFLKIKQDPTTLGVLIAVPVLQIALFGYAIEFFPKNIPTAVVSYDNSAFTRNFIQTMQSTNYYGIQYAGVSEQEPLDLLKTNKINYIITIPPLFTRDLIRGNKPEILLEVDASTPGIMGGAIQAANELQYLALNRNLVGSLDFLKPQTSPFRVNIHNVFNENLTTANSMTPGLIAVIILMSLSTITSMVIVDEITGGNIEVLLNSSFQPFEIVLGKFLCYLLVGYLQLLTVAYVGIFLLFHVQMKGSMLSLMLSLFPFIASSLMTGLMASCVAKTPVDAFQISSAIILPSLLLSGFVFPFYGMPAWAQSIGNLLPATHAIRILGGILYKDFSLINILNQEWPILIYTLVFVLITIFSFKRTLN